MAQKRRMISLALGVAMMTSAFTGCSTEKKEQPKEVTQQEKKETIITEEEKVEAVDPWAGVTDASDLPDWTGKQLSLTVWNAHGTGILERSNKSTKDVVTPELKRVTGVEFNPDTSYDNGGSETMEIRLGRMAATRDWPDIMIRYDETQFRRLVASGVVYDLTDLIPQYAPNIMSLMPQNEDFKRVWEACSADGTMNTPMYALPYSAIGREYATKHPDLLGDYEQKNIDAYFGTAVGEYSGSVFIRDDIAKMIFPEALSVAEAEERWKSNGGTFYPEDVLDIKITSVDEFFDMLYKIRDLNIKEGNRDVYPTYVSNGGDNWALMTVLSGALYGYHNAVGSGNDYLTPYWDRQTNQLEYLHKTDVFKDALKRWNMAVRDGVAAKESLLDTNPIFKEKLNNGLYAVSYFSDQPDRNALKQAEKPYGYRRIVIQIPPQYDRFIHKEGYTAAYSVAIFKDKVKEEDLPQILRYFDFMSTEAGQNLATWGPRSAGLFEEKDGKRVFIDKELEEAIVYNSKNEKDIEYNLVNKNYVTPAWPGYAYNWLNYHHPILGYDLQASLGNINGEYNKALSLFPMKETFPFEKPNYTEELAEAKNFSAARNAFEGAIKTIFTASSDEQFEKLYQDMLNLAEQSGYTDAALQKMNEMFIETNEKLIPDLMK